MDDIEADKDEPMKYVKLFYTTDFVISSKQKIREHLEIYLCVDETDVSRYFSPSEEDKKKLDNMGKIYVCARYPCYDLIFTHHRCEPVLITHTEYENLVSKNNGSTVRLRSVSSPQK